MAKTSVYIPAVLPEPLLLVYTKYGSKPMFTSNIRALAQLDMVLIVRKPIFGVRDMVLLKPACSVTEIT